jgi:uncharacterized protein YjbI with pentapeptide repeats
MDPSYIRLFGYVAAFVIFHGLVFGLIVADRAIRARRSDWALEEFNWVELALLQVLCGFWGLLYYLYKSRGSRLAAVVGLALSGLCVLPAATIGAVIQKVGAQRAFARALAASQTARKAVGPADVLPGPGADMADRNLRGAHLRGANLRGATLSGSNLTGADMFGAILTGADLTGTNFSQANLGGAVLAQADLRGAVLRGAVLRGAVLAGAQWGKTICPDGTNSDDATDATCEGHVAVLAPASDGPGPKPKCCDSPLVVSIKGTRWTPRSGFVAKSTLQQGRLAFNLSDKVLPPSTGCVEPRFRSIPSSIASATS